MKILIDERLPRPIVDLLVGHSARTVQEVGWKGSSNGMLLELAEQEYDHFLTSDQSRRYQQNLERRKIAILMLSTNHWETIHRSAEEIRKAIEIISPRGFRELEIGKKAPLGSR